MASSDPVTRFVHDALAAGRSRTEIQNALSEAGWAKSDVDKALSAFADVDFTPPVPRPRPQLTARDVFVYALLFTALTFTAVYLINLVHGILDLALPDPADRSNAEARAIYRIRWAIATLIVSTPLYVWMTIFTGRQNAKQVGEKRSLVRRWLTYLALFASALTFFGDITYVLERFLEGEFTLRFLLKALTVGAVSASIFFFYLRDVEADRDGH
ncbi:DUF5671 domain-containing protein [Oricola nitratireducens]|jgi:hypothetical protein|uniref:DUF5671 domain-containing protein n=1 Tax=Oricola nitratireducens TaxID=2775868 RepID=UPI001867EC9C|nr:DUF5671 domain-containing protein [Oricola nitratireducens]